MHGGTCKDLLADYNCTCAPGYAGENCSVGKGSCDSDIRNIKSYFMNGYFDCDSILLD